MYPASKKELALGRFFTGEIDDAQPAQHHAGSGAAEDGKQREILQVDDGKRGGVNGSAQFAESEVSAKRAEESQKSATGEEQAGCVDQSCETAFVDTGDGIEAGVLCGRRFGRQLCNSGRRSGRVEAKRRYILCFARFWRLLAVRQRRW
jgi:hypothetical protein